MIFARDEALHSSLRSVAARKHSRTAAPTQRGGASLLMALSGSHCPLRHSNCLKPSVRCLPEDAISTGPTKFELRLWLPPSSRPSKNRLRVRTGARRGNRAEASRRAFDAAEWANANNSWIGSAVDVDFAHFHGEANAGQRASRMTALPTASLTRCGAPSDVSPSGGAESLNDQAANHGECLADSDQRAGRRFGACRTDRVRRSRAGGNHRRPRQDRRQWRRK